MAISKQLGRYYQKHPHQQPYLYYSLVALFVMLPMLSAGYILTLDMVFTPKLPMPDAVTSSYLFRAGLHYVNVVVPSDIIQKVLLFTILLMSGLGMHRLMQHLRPAKAERTEYETWGTYIAGILYVINPFTYSRFMAGQYSVLLGYAMLPFFVRALFRFLAKPERNQALRLSAWVIAISIVSIHTLGPVAILGVLATSFYGWRHRKQHKQIKTIGLNGLLAFGVFVVASCYWLIPLARGEGNTAQALDRFSSTDMNAFATTGGSVIGRLGNVIRLQGFWAEARNLYLMPQDRIPGWGLIFIGILVLVVMGALAMWRRWKRSEVAVFAVAAVVAMVLAVGSFNNWLANVVPFFSGYRDPHKFVALVALAYAVFAGQGAIALLHRYKQRSRKLSADIATSILLIVPIALTPTMPWAFAGQLKPKQYPPDWYTMNDFLRDNKTPFVTVFVPWHLYTHFAFAGRIIANPAPDFFDKPMLVSDDPEFGDVKPTLQDNDKQIAGSILAQAARHDDLGTQLAPLHVKYILLAKEYDADNYGYLGYQKDLSLVRETDTLKLYRNDAFEEE